MSQQVRSAIVWHLAGLVFAGLLALASYWLYLYIPGWITGTFLRGYGNLATFVVVIGMLSVAERGWVHLQSRTRPGRPH